MKKLFTLLFLAFATWSFSQTMTICNPNGNIIIYSNYDGGNMTINVDQNIPNLKIGIVSYEFSRITITGAFVGNVTGVWYAGYNAGNNHCNLNPPFNTTITGVANPIDTITIYPPATYSNPNGSANIVCNYSCSTTTNQGGCNTPDQIVHFFQTKFGGIMRYHYTQYGCWGTYSVSQGGNCCAMPNPTGLVEEMPSLFSVFPNPSSGAFNLSFDSFGQRTVEVMDLMGKVIYHTIIQGMETKIDLGSIANGHYLMRVTDDQGSSEGKIIAIAR